MVKLTGISKREFWTQQIEEWKASALSQKAFCIQKQLSFVQFQYWRKRCQDKKMALPDEAKQPSIKKWLDITPCELPPLNSSPPLQIELAGLCKITVPMTQDVHYLSTLFTLLGLHHVCQK